jgi:hypothetical protein
MQGFQSIRKLFDTGFLHQVLRLACLCGSEQRLCRNNGRMTRSTYVRQSSQLWSQWLMTAGRSYSDAAVPTGRQGAAANQQ